MSIKPIDLQTMFAQMHHVGKTESIEKNAAHLQQMSEGQALAEKELKSDHQVNKTHETDENKIIKDKEPESSEQKDSEHKDSEHKEENEEENETKQWFEDPEKGQNIDISG